MLNRSFYSTKIITEHPSALLRAIQNYWKFSTIFNFTGTAQLGVHMNLYTCICIVCVCMENCIKSGQRLERPGYWSFYRKNILLLRISQTAANNTLKRYVVHVQIIRFSSSFSHIFPSVERIYAFAYSFSYTRSLSKSVLHRTKRNYDSGTCIFMDVYVRFRGYMHIHFMCIYVSGLICMHVHVNTFIFMYMTYIFIYTVSGTGIRTLLVVQSFPKRTCYLKHTGCSSY